MSAMSNSEFAKHVREMALPASFVPHATYDANGDCVEFLFKPDNFYAERIDDLVTVYYSRNTKEPIGSLIKSVSSFCDSVSKKLPGFKITIVDGKVKLEHLFLAKMWTDDSPVNSVTYRKLIDAASENKTEAELLGSC